MSVQQHPGGAMLAAAVREGAANLGRLGYVGEHGVEVFARVLLSGCGEPGDGALGRVVAALGPEDTATRLLAASAGSGRDFTNEVFEAVGGAGGEIERRELSSGLARWIPRLDVVRTLRAIAEAVRYGARLCVPDHPAWPLGMNDLGDHAPLVLWVLGEIDLIRDPSRCVSIVGSRALTAYGERIAVDLAGGMADRGFVVVSGGAYGIDGVAHRSVLASAGHTVALLAGGLDRFYPAGHETLLQQIAQRGAVVSELRCGERPTRWRFLQRNRLIAAASGVTVVVEAGWRSGALNTAAHAATIGRHIGAVPGPVTSPSSAGCHRLFREFDAICITSVADLGELIGPRPVELPGFEETSNREARVCRANGDGSADADTVADGEHTPDTGGSLRGHPLRVIGKLLVRKPQRVDEIAQRAGLSPSETIAALGRLAACGLASRTGDGWTASRVSGAASARAETMLDL